MHRRTVRYEEGRLMQILEDKSSFSKYRREKAAKDQWGSHSKRKEKI